MPDGLSLTFSALADPTRRAILARLASGEANVSDLAKPFMKAMSLPAVTKHLKVLESAGLVRKSRAAQWRTCSLNPKPLKEATDWIEEYRRVWEDCLDRLGDYLDELQVQQAQSGKRAPKTAPGKTAPAKTSSTKRKRHASSQAQ